MSEWLTTGEMIDRLKVGEIAENESGFIKVSYHKSGDLIYKMEGNKDEGYTFYFNVYGKHEKWRILPNYVSFEEAMKAMKKGAAVRCYPEDGGYYGFNESDHFISVAKSCGGLTLHDLAYGKWTIEE